MTTVFLTGATGFIGGATLAQGLAAGMADRWYCLVRGTDIASAKHRLIANLSRFMGETAALAAADRVDVICGDVADVDAIAHEGLDAVTHVLHLAADTSFMARGNCDLVNVAGTRAMALRARRMKKLSRFVFGGTAMICGRDAPPVVHEADFPSVEAAHIVSYTKSKVDAETLLRSEFADLPVVVARPSIVVGHSVLGCGPSSSIFWMFRAGDRLRLVAGAPQGGIDVVPVDWTAQVLLGLLFRPALRHGVYHLSAGSEKRTSWAGLAAAFQRCDPAGGPRLYTHVDEGGRQILRSRFAAAFGLAGALEVAMMRAMRAYYEFSALDVVFANDRVIDEGFPPPPSLPEYLGLCLAQPSGLSILDQFADDLGMFAPGRIASERPSTAAA